MRQVFMQTLTGECGGGGRQAVCTPQSVPNVHIGSSEPGLPSSQSALEAKKLVFVQMPDGTVGGGCTAGDRGGGDGMETRRPQPT
jgi:hypothetical protein